jgi:hypothetical protein
LQVGATLRDATIGETPPVTAANTASPVVTKTRLRECDTVRESIAAYGSAAAIRHPLGS